MAERQMESSSQMKDNRNPSASRIGVYVCHCGGNISDVVDVEKVVQAASQLPNVVVSRHNSAMCSQTGQDLVTEDIQNEKLDRVVIAACTPGLHEHTFRAAVVRGGLNPFLYEHANIREQVSWCSKSDPEGATQKAIRLVAAGVAKADLLEPLVPVSGKVRHHVTVVGGGISGLRAARDLSRAGFPVTLLEQSPNLGGQITQWAQLYPTGEKGNLLARPLIEEVQNDPNIDVYTNTEIRQVSGYVGDFHVIAQQAVGDAEGQPDLTDIEFHSGAIVLATGFQLYEPKTGEFGYGQFPEVITLAQLEKLLAEDHAANTPLQYHGKTVRNLCLIHCVGSRQIEGIHEAGANGRVNDYCSRVCCTSSLQATADVRKRFPDVNVFELYRDIRTYGRNHEDYYEDASKQGVLFCRYEPENMPTVSQTDRGDGSPLCVTVRDKLTFDEEVAMPADLVVLATGMVPRNLDNLIEQLKLSRSADGFLQEVHPKLQPVEMAVSGIFVAGTCQAPMDTQESCASASAVASKVAALLGKGHIEMDPYRAKVDLEKCTGEGRCVDVCEHQKAITLVDVAAEGGTHKRAEVNSLLCNGCGMCVAVCPNQAIQVAGWQMDQFNAMVDALVQQ